MSVKQVAILGSTGSIGVNTLDVIRAHPDRFNVVALTAAKQVDLLAQQCAEFKPAIAVVSDADGAARGVGHAEAGDVVDAEANFRQHYGKRHGHAGSPRLPREQQRQGAVSRDDAYGINGWVHRSASRLQTDAPH